jgi:hypothetical protein
LRRIHKTATGITANTGQDGMNHWAVRAMLAQLRGKCSWRSVEIGGDRWRSVEIGGDRWRSVEIGGDRWIGT